MATATRSYGTKIYRETSPASGTYTEIGGVTSLNWPAVQAEVADTTQMGAASAFRTRIPTVLNLGECTFNLHFDSSDATQGQMLSDLVAGTVRTYQIIGVDSGAETQTFAAYVTNFQPTSEVDGLMVAAVTLTPSGSVTRT